MLAAHLSTALGRRAGAFLSGAQFAGAADAGRIADLLAHAAVIARSGGLAGVEGFAAALGHGTDPADHAACAAIERAINEAMRTTTGALWSGDLAA